MITRVVNNFYSLIYVPFKNNALLSLVSQNLEKPTKKTGFNNMPVILALLIFFFFNT